MALKYDWYQTESDVVINVIRKAVNKDDCKLEFDASGSKLRFIIHPSDSEDSTLDLDLSHPVNVTKAAFKCTASKVEIKVQKMEGGNWPTLIKAQAAKDAKELAHAYPSSKGPKNWDKLEKEAKEEEEKEKLEGDAAVNKLFQTIYRDASDDVKKAMMKSYQESNGTCLSTNWEEVSKGKVECKPPDSMEWKKY